MVIQFYDVLTGSEQKYTKDTPPRAWCIYGTEKPFGSSHIWKLSCECVCVEIWGKRETTLKKNKHPPSGSQYK